MTYYVRPLHFIDSPQSYKGKSLRLAGALIWFTAVEIFAKKNNIIDREIVPLDDWDDHITKYNGHIQQRLNLLYSNLISERKPIKMGDKILRLDQPQVMAILNITPDSFSDGGQFTQGDDVDEAAANAGYVMAAQGAAIIDIGGESTRPGAKTLWEGDEISRILPTIKRLAPNCIISVDTRKSMVMEQALSEGAAIINDISSLGYDKRSAEIIRNFDAPIILMHAPSQGDNPHENAHYNDVVFDVYDWLERRVKQSIEMGINADKIMIDVGIGFGKSLTENLNLINNLSLFHAIGVPIVFGASRKRLIGALSGEEDSIKRLGGSLALALKALDQGVHIVRVHDLPETVQAVRTWRGMRDAALTVKA